MRHRLDTARRDGGFSLVELLVVVVIIGVLAAIALPIYNNQKQKASGSAATSDLRAAVQEVTSAMGDVVAWGTGPTLTKDSSSTDAILVLKVDAGTSGTFLSGGSNKLVNVRVSPGTTFVNGSLTNTGAWCMVFANSGQYSKMTDATNLQTSASALTCA